MKRTLAALVLFTGLPLLTHVSAHESAADRPVDPNAPTATVSVTQGGGQANTVEVRLEPREANAGGELFLSLSRGQLHKRRVLQQAEPGTYRLAYAFPEPGRWDAYLRYGAGQAGSVASTDLNLIGPPAAARTEAVSVRFQDGFSHAVPRYVQPLGYAAFGVLAALAVVGVAYLLRRIRRAPEPSSLLPTEAR